MVESKSNLKSAQSAEGEGLVRKVKCLAPWALAISGILLVIFSWFMQGVSWRDWLAWGGMILSLASVALVSPKARVRITLWFLVALMILAFLTATLLPPKWMIPEQRAVSRTVGWHQIGPTTWEAEWESFTHTCYRGDFKNDLQYGCRWALQIEKLLQTLRLLPESAS